MSVMKIDDFKDLETRGFVLVRGFLSEPELQVCRDDFARQPLKEDSRNATLSGVSGKAHEVVRERVREVLGLVAAGTSLRVNLPLGADYFATTRFASPWHQDHESFFLTQNHHDYLNFYIPIIKPRRDKTNLSIVPFDVLESAAPKTFRKVVGGGAARFSALRNRTLVYFDDRGSVHLMGKDLEKLAFTPELEAGDLLLLRGDMIHRTQDAETERVSVSFRAVNAETPVRRLRLVDGGLRKAWMMVNNAPRYQRMFQAFESAGRTEMGFSELQHTMDGLPASEPIGRKRFFRYLLQEKRREHVLMRFLRKSLTEVLTDVTARALAGRRPS